MLRYLQGADLTAHPYLADTMFRDRARQFRDRLRWDVMVDGRGWEIDEYDGLDPLYVIWETPEGRHGGSMRFLPTTGRTMINEHFIYLTDGVAIQSPFIWECTRFCLSPGADMRASAALVLGAGEVMQHMRLAHYIGVFDGRMEQIYRRMGLEPEVLGRQGRGRDAIAVGLWEMKAEVLAPTLAKVGVDRALSRAWVRRSFGEGAGVAGEVASA